MANYQPWVYPGHWSMEEHNAVLAELRKADAEIERMGTANNEACDRIAELEAALDAITRDRDFYRDEYQPVSAARDAAEARVRELEAQLAAVTAQRDAIRKERDQLAQNLIQRNLPDFYRLLKTTADAPPMEEVARQAECEDVELVAAVWQHASEYFECKIKELSLELEKTEACFATRNEELNLIAEVLKVHRVDIVDEIHRLKTFALKCEVDAVVSDAPDPDELGRIAVREWMSAGLTNVPFDALPDAEKTAMRCMVIAVWNHGRQENQALLKDVATHADNAQHWMCHANQWERMYNELLEKYKRRDAQYLEVKAGEQREGTRVYELEKDIYCLRNELAAHATRPVRVRFDVTAEEFADWKLQTFGWGNSLVYAKQELDYLLDKAVIDVPPGIACPYCEGEGSYYLTTAVGGEPPDGSREDCPKCKGTGIYVDVPPGVPTLEELAELIYSHVRTGRNYATSEPELKAAAAAIRDAVLAGVAPPLPLGVPGVEELHDIGLKAFESHNGGTYHDSRVAQTTAIRDAVLAGVGECQECAAAKRAVQIERDGVNALAARINAARAARIYMQKGGQG